MQTVPTTIARDLKHIWHPCSQMKDYETIRPLEVVGANGSYLELKDTTKIIDAISSWWCKSLGHNHPRLKAALLAQVDQFEHVILANTTNETIVALSEQLARLSPSLDKVLFASDGACAVEMALKMSIHARKILGQPERRVFLTLENSFHGETTGALSVSDLGIYRAPYAPLLFESHIIGPLPYVTRPEGPLWDNCEWYWQKIERSLAPFAETATALIVEPIIQAVGHMKLYSQDFLRRLRQWATAHQVHLIADEIMTGFGRTGKMLACEHAGIEPDFLCLAKGLTAGWLPMSVMLTRGPIYDLFYDDYHFGKSFLHSHTHSGNVLAASVALEVLKITNDENICDRATQLGDAMFSAMSDIANATQKLTNVRGIGAIVAADLICQYPTQRAGFDVFQQAIKLGALLRPLGNTIYWVPPLNMSLDTLMALKEITERAIRLTHF